MAKTVVGLYDQFRDAQSVVRDLVEAGFARENISLVANDARGEYSRDLQGVDVQEGEAAATGAGIGAAMGGIAGLLVGLGALAIPGIGPVLAAGPLIAALGGAGVGAITGGIIGALTDAGISESDANVYAEGVRRGGTLVTVYTTDELANRAADIMNRHSPVNLEKRASEWSQSNWSTFDEGAEPFAFDRTRMESQPMEASTRADMTGASTYNEMDTDQTVYSDRMMSFEMYEPRFREHFQNRYSMGGNRWEEYRDSYHYGFDMGQTPQYMNTDWSRVRGDLRRDWEMRYNDRRWDDYEEAVHQGWLTSRESR